MRLRSVYSMIILRRLLDSPTVLRWRREAAAKSIAINHAALFDDLVAVSE